MHLDQQKDIEQWLNECSGSRLLSICVPSLVLIAQAVFLLERGQTNRHTETDVTERPNHAGSYTAGVGNNRRRKLTHIVSDANNVSNYELLITFFILYVDVFSLTY